MASNNVINTELVESIARGLKFISRLMPENIFYVGSSLPRLTIQQNIIKVSKINNPPNGPITGGNFTFSFIISNRGVLRKYFLRKNPGNFSFLTLPLEISDKTKLHLPLGTPQNFVKA